MVDAYAGQQFRVPAQHRAGLRQEAATGVLGVEADLDGMPAQFHLLLPQRQRMALGDADLPGHQVLAGDQFGDRVFDLQAGIHLQEVEATILAEKKLDGAGAHVVDRGRGLHRRLAHGATQVGIEHRAGGFLDDLLVAALHRAVAFAEVEQVAVAVAEHLDLHVARARHGPLQDQLGAAEGAQRFRARGAQLFQQLAGFLHQAHAAAAAAGAGLDHQRVADAFGLAPQGRVVLFGAFVAGDARHPGGEHGDLRQALAAHQVDGFRIRADEDDPGGFAGTGEFGVLGEEAVAGVDRLGAAATGGVKDRLEVQVGLRHRCRADAHGLVGQLHMAGVGVRLAVHGDAAVAQFMGGAQHPAGDFTAVGDEDSCCMANNTSSRVVKKATALTAQNLYFSGMSLIQVPIGGFLLIGKLMARRHYLES
ncbi:hypothetical protein P797_35190 [Pseudomonas aeruginosa VRFPA04]|nr:hypothetical protein P797_35190 [Pseudomonas aeruginosa VRFPA04]